MSDDYKLPPSKAILPVMPTDAELRQDRVADLKAQAESAAPAAMPPLPTDNPMLRRKLIEGRVIGVLQSVFDPEIPVNIYELGLIYGVNVDDADNVHVVMTLTAPACPVAGTLPGEVERKIEAIPEVKSAKVELVWEPAWDKSRMSEAAMLELGFF